MDSPLRRPVSPLRPGGGAAWHGKWNVLSARGNLGVAAAWLLLGIVQNRIESTGL